MPIYEYRCNKCGEVFEQLVLVSDCEDGFCCPSCGHESTCRLMSSFSCGSSSGKGQSGISSAGSSPSSGGFS
jgi:putative FmdB family regulatory protein